MGPPCRLRKQILFGASNFGDWPPQILLPIIALIGTKSRIRPMSLRHHLITPEILETCGRKLGIAHCVLDVLVPEIILDRSCVVTIACQLEAGCMAQHVCVGLEREARLLSRTFDQPVEAIRCKWSAAFAHKHERGLRSFTFELAQRPQFVTADGMCARLSILDPVYMQRSSIKIDLLPA